MHNSLQLIIVLLKNILRRDADLGEVFRQFGEQRDQLGNGYIDLTF